MNSALTTLRLCPVRRRFGRRWHRELGRCRRAFTCSRASRKSGWARSCFAIRFPELIGFLAASLCLFHFIRRRTNALYGLVGMLACGITGAYPFAYEARPYGLVLGFCGLALVCWQAATEN